MTTATEGVADGVQLEISLLADRFQPVKSMDHNGDIENKCAVQNAVGLERQELLDSFPHTKQVGAYLIGRTIGEGSFAKVKEGLHILTGEKVAVKVIDKRKARADKYVRRNMRREARLLQRIRHGNIVQLLDVMETENGFYLVMEHCGGGDLMTKICSSQRLEEPEARQYVRQIVSAVDYLHRAGILHRDLKVENLLLDESGKIKIIDFGLSNVVRRGMADPIGSRWGLAASKSQSDTEHVQESDGRHGVTSAAVDDPDNGVDQLTRVGETTTGGLADDLCSTQCGSPAYAAPELLSGTLYGPKVDIWSIGVNMYAMLTGNLPFTVEPFSVRALLNKMMTGQMNELPEHLSKNCQDLLKRLLTANPDRRITLYQAMHHPWLADSRNKPMEPAPFPNQLTESALCRAVVDSMVDQLSFKFDEVVRLVTSNMPSGATATYHLLLKRSSNCWPKGPVTGTTSSASTLQTAFCRRLPLAANFGPSDDGGQTSIVIGRKLSTDDDEVDKKVDQENVEMIQSEGEKKSAMHFDDNLNEIKSMTTSTRLSHSSDDDSTSDLNLSEPKQSESTTAGIDSVQTDIVRSESMEDSTAVNSSTCHSLAHNLQENRVDRDQMLSSIRCEALLPNLVPTAAVSSEKLTGRLSPPGNSKETAVRSIWSSGGTGNYVIEGGELGAMRQSTGRQQQPPPPPVMNRYVVRLEVKDLVTGSGDDHKPEGAAFLLSPKRRSGQKLFPGIATQHAQLQQHQQRQYASATKHARSRPTAVDNLSHGVDSSRGNQTPRHNSGDMRPQRSASYAIPSAAPCRVIQLQFNNGIQRPPQSTIRPRLAVSPTGRGTTAGRLASGAHQHQQLQQLTSRCTVAKVTGQVSLQLQTTATVPKTLAFCDDSNALPQRPQLSLRGNSRNR